MSLKNRYLIFTNFSQVWDVLSNNDIVEIVAWTPSQINTTKYLVKHDVRAWRLKYPISNVDDCGVVCISSIIIYHLSQNKKTPVSQDPSSQALLQEITWVSAIDSWKYLDKNTKVFSDTNILILEHANTDRNANDLNNASQNLNTVKNSKEQKGA